MKTCFKCGLAQPLDQFYAHPMMADGLLGKCKACTKRDVSERRARNIDAIREYDRSRADLPHRKQLRERIVREWGQNHPTWKAAQIAVRNAIKAGLLVRPKRCSRCREAKRIEAHHHDYGKPLVVEWLCKPCHAQADKERRAA